MFPRWQNLLFALVAAMALASGPPPSGATPSGLSDEQDQALRREIQEYMQELSGRVFYTRPMFRKDLRQDDLKADRILELGEVRMLLYLSSYLLDDENRFLLRWWAAEDLGALGHQYGVPVLLAVLRNEEAPCALRRRCVQSLANVLDQGMVQHLIDDGLGSDSPEVAAEALAQLLQFVVPAVGLPEGVDLEQPVPEAVGHRETYLHRWQQWWQEKGQRPVLLKRTGLEPVLEFLR